MMRTIIGILWYMKIYLWYTYLLYVSNVSLRSFQMLESLAEEQRKLNQQISTLKTILEDSTAHAEKLGQTLFELHDNLKETLSWSQIAIQLYTYIQRIKRTVLFLAHQ